MTDRQENVPREPQPQPCYFLLWASDSGSIGISHPGFPSTPLCSFSPSVCLQQLPFNTWPRLPSASFPISSPIPLIDFFPTSFQSPSLQFSLVAIDIVFRSNQQSSIGQHPRFHCTHTVGSVETATLQEADAYNQHPLCMQTHVRFWVQDHADNAAAHLCRV